jgi:hypothetical protein
VPVAVVGCEQPDRPHPVVRLFQGLPDRGFGRRFAHVCPASRQGPTPLVWFFDEQDPAVPKHCSPYVHLRGRWTGFESEQVEGFLQGSCGVGCKNLSSQLPELFVSPEVVIISGIGQAVLGNGLQAPGPPEPLRVGKLVVS